MRVFIIIVSAVVAKTGILQRFDKLLPARLLLRLDDAPPAFGLVHPRVPGPTLIALPHQLGAVVLARAS